MENYFIDDLRLRKFKDDKATTYLTTKEINNFLASLKSKEIKNEINSNINEKDISEQFIINFLLKKKKIKLKENINTVKIKLKENDPYFKILKNKIENLFIYNPEFLDNILDGLDFKKNTYYINIIIETNNLKDQKFTIQNIFISK
jgi:hypothetical protein